jgi:N utilization substance protein A
MIKSQSIFSSNAMARTELLEIADSVAREKGIQKEDVIDAMESAIQKASRAKYGQDKDIRAHIDRKTGEITLNLYHEVVAEVEDEMTQLTLDEARKVLPEINIGEFIVDPLPPIDFGRVAAQTAKQVIFQKVRDAERLKQYNEYKDRNGDVISGVVRRVEFGNVYVEIGQAEAFLPKDQLIPREVFKPGDRIKSYVSDVRQEPRGPQIFLSRTHPMFIAQMFAQEVPEIYDGDLEIKGISRDPGSKAKMAVYSDDKSLDPVGACVGVRGSRVQAIVNELQGEKIDIIPWSSNPAVFVVNALIPAEVTKVVVDEDTHRIMAVVSDDQLSLAIGRRGQNVRLASELTKWGIDIISESVESERRQKEMRAKTELFVSAIDVDEMLAHVLLNEGFDTVEDLAAVSLEELISIEGLDEDVAKELQQRAHDYVLIAEKNNKEECENLGVNNELKNLEGMRHDVLVVLARNGIKTLDDFADLAADELIEMIPSMSQHNANRLIMKARSGWFENDKDLAKDSLDVNNTDKKD